MNASDTAEIQGGAGVTQTTTEDGSIVLPNAVEKKRRGSESFERIC